jgi:hypothetical protein
VKRVRREEGSVKFLQIKRKLKSISLSYLSVEPKHVHLKILPRVRDEIPIRYKDSKKERESKNVRK